MGRRDELLRLLDEVVQRIRATGDPSLAWSPGVIAMADDLAESLDEREQPDIRARHQLGWLKWYQAEAAPSERRLELVDEAFELLADPALGGIGLAEFPEPLVPALVDQAASRLRAMLQYAVAAPDTGLLSDLVDQWIQVLNATPDGHPDRAQRLAVACGGLVSRCQRTGEADLDDALAAGRRAVELGSDDGDLGMYLSNLGAALKLRYERVRDSADLDEAIVVARQAVTVAVGNEGWAVAAANLSGVLAMRFDREGRPEDVAEATQAARQAVATVSPHDPNRAAMLNNLAKALHGTFKITQSSADLDEALHAARQAVLVGEGQPDATMRLSNLADVLESRFALTGSEADLDEAIVVTRHLVDSTPVEHRSHGQVRLVSLLSARVDRASDAADLDELISVNRQAVSADLGSAPLLSSLSAALLFRYQQTDTTANLDEATILARRAVAISAANDLDDGLVSLLQLDRALWARFQRSGAPGDLDEVIVTRRSIIDATPTGSAELTERLSRLGEAMFTRFSDRGTPADLDEAIATVRSALAAAAIDIERMSCQADLSCALLRRFEYAGTRADLDEAADIARSVATLAHPEPSPELLISMAIVLGIRWRGSGTLDDLDAAVGLVRRAAAAMTSEDRSRANRARGHIQLRIEGIWTDPTTDGEPGQTEVQRLLDAYLMGRFEWTNVQADVDALVRSRREAITTTTADSAEHARKLASLGHGLKLRYHQTGSRADLDEAVMKYRQALAIDPRNAGYLVSLSDAMKHRFLADQDEADLEEAVALGRRATQNGQWADALGNLSQVLQTLFELHPYTTDIDEAVDAARQALDAEDDHFDRPKWLLILGEALLTRIIHASYRPDPRGESGREEDRAEALRALSEQVRFPAAPPRLRVHGAKAAAWLAAGAPATPGPEDLALASDFAETAINLLPELAPRRMRRAEQQSAIESAAGLAGDAVTLALAEPTRPPAERARRALSLLEAGRAVLLGQLLGTRGDLTKLQEAHPDLAARFTALRDFLDRDDDPALPGNDRIGAAAELATTLREIRGLEGFNTFALPPSADELLAVADQGPVVSFNVAGRGHALLLTREGISALHLPAVTAPTVIDQVNAFHVALREAHDPAGDRVAAQGAITKVLKWLWDNVTDPVLKALGYHASPADGMAWPRVWWAPGGYLGLLPLHAAGHHDDPASGKTVMDRVVSSYTPTIRALRHARQRQAATSTAPNGSLVVAMPTTPGLPDLPNVAHETKLLVDILPDPFVLTEPTRDRVLADLSGRAIVHFACHGNVDRDNPAASRLLLHDHDKSPLTVADLAAINLDSAQLAYLSACHTALNPAERLLEEGMHLTAALQAAGFPQVVGTLWELDEEIAVEITSDFYTGLRDPQTGNLDLGHAAHSLHRAIRMQRDVYRDTPSLWASHQHFGA